MKRMILVAALVSVGSVFASVHTNSWIGGASGRWNEPSSYSDGVVPGSVPGDDYVVELGDTAQEIAVDTTDTESFASFNAIKWIRPGQTSASKLVISVPSGTAEVKPAISYYGYENRGDWGTVVKTGQGTLKLTSYMNYTESGRATDYMTSFDIREGTLRLPDVPETGKYVSLGNVTVAAGATFVAATYTGASASGLANTKMYSLSGGGSVVRDEGAESSADQYLRIVGDPVTTDAAGERTFFSGNFSGRIDEGFQVILCGQCALAGMENVFSGFTAYGNLLSGRYYPAVIEIAKFGKKGVGQASSIGTNRTITASEGRGLVLRYTGTGEVTDKNLNIETTEHGAVEVDGGANGGLEWAGVIQHTGNTVMNDRLVLANEGAKPCVFSGELNTRTFTTAEGTYDFHVLKEGSGAWLFRHPANTANRTFAGGITIREGALQFETLGARGKVGSLGTALNLHDYASGKDLPAVDYAFTLGSTNGTEAVLESVGTQLPPLADNSTTNRTIALDGRGTLRSSGAWTGFAGVSGKTAGNHTLVLDGTNEMDNVVTDITDGNGTVSVEKNGSGTWAIGRETSFSGSLAVNAGKLIVRKADRYSWYKWNIQQSDDADLTISQFALYDKDGVRQNVGLSSNAVWKSVKEGECTYASAYYLSHRTGNSGVASPFSGSSDPAWNVRVYKNANLTGLYRAVITDPASWFPLVMRLDPNANEVVSYDWNVSYAGTATKAKYNPKWWTVEASVDGLNWVEIDAQNKVDVPTTVPYLDYYPDAGYWFFGKTTKYAGDAAEGAHLSGQVFENPRPAQTFTALENVSAVSVAAGASLVAEGGVIDLPENITLKLDCANSNGTAVVRGFAFPANGTIDVTNRPKRESCVLPFDFTGSTGLDALSTWTVTDGGKPARFTVSLTDSGIRLEPSGLIIIMR